MLEEQKTNGLYNLVIYGPLESGHEFESCTDLYGGQWSDTGVSVGLTNLVQSVLIMPDGNAVEYYRSRRIQ